MLVRARTVVTMADEPIEDGAVLIDGDRIVAVGKFNDLKNQGGVELIDLGERILLPGLINAHCHLDYTLLRGEIPRQASFTDWIRAINAAKANISPHQYVESINDGFAEAARFGTTTVANLTAFPELIAQITEPIRTWWFAELIDIRQPNDARRMANDAVERLKSTPRWGLAPHAPFTASPDLYRRCAEIARQQNALLTTHLAESVEEMQMSSATRGPLRDFLAAINPNLFQSNGRTPVENVISTVGSIDDRWLIVHLNSIGNADAELLARQSTKCHVIHCPRSHEYFGHERFQFEQLRKLGFNICLGTDSLASNKDLSLFAEMRRFAEIHTNVSCREIIEMVTINAARALRQQSLLGCIQAGALADLIAIGQGASGNVFEQVVNNPSPTAWLMVGGRQL